MEHDEMVVIMEDGLRVVFFRDEEDDDTVKFIMFNGGAFYENEVDEFTIHAVVGEPLSLTYYYGYGSRADIKTETVVKEIKYDDECDD